MSKKPEAKKPGKKSKKSPGGAIVPKEKAEVYLKQTFELYGIWKNLPPVLRKLSPEDLEEQIGIDDPVIVELLKIRNQTEFAAAFDVRQETLSQWNKRLDETSAVGWIKKWSKGMIRNVLLASYQNAKSKSGTAFMDRQLLFKVLDDYEDKSRVTVEGLAEGILAAMKSAKRSK